MKITSSNYKKDKLYAAEARAITEILKTETVVAPVEVLMQMQRISKPRYEDWRFRRIPYLEKVFVGSLGKANRILRILEFHARAIGLQPSQTVYHKWGKGGKRFTLRFSKSAHPRLEQAYSRHYVTGKKPKRIEADR